MAEIGSTLREARMRARIDISEVEARTKIRAKYLRAIENEEWDLLPGTVYVKSFLRTYGDFLGLDSRLLIDEFKRRYERPDDHELRAISSVGRERERGQRRQSGRPSLGGRLSSGASLSPRLVIVLALVVIVVALDIIGNNTGNTPSSNVGATTHHHHHKKPPKSSTTSTRGQTTTNTTRTRTTPPPPREATLAIVATGEVWVCEKGEPGNKLLIGGADYLTGQKVPTQRAREILVSLGNTNVQVTANGKPFTVTNSTAGIGLKVTPRGVTQLPQAPNCV